jgi:ATP-binding cassette, subfamily B, bacterial
MALFSFLNKGFRFFPQLEAMDCGPACLQMVAFYHGKHFPLDYMRQIADITHIGTTLETLSGTANKIGLDTKMELLPFRENGNQDLMHISLPCIIHWNQDHFVVVYKITSEHVYMADPGKGKFHLRHEDFIKPWNSTGQPGDKGYALTLTPGKDFSSMKIDRPKSPSTIAFLRSNFKKHRRSLIYVFLLILVITLLQSVYPYLTKSIVDEGINQKDISLVLYFLWGQLLLFLGRTSFEFMRSWLMIRIGNRMQLGMINDYLQKIMLLPIRFFDSRLMGDIFQRYSEIGRIGSFLTGTTLSTLFSVFTFVGFSVVLFLFHKMIFLVHIVFSVLYISWLILFTKRRKRMDYELFNQYSVQQSNFYEMLTGIREIKLNNTVQHKIQHWMSIQGRLFKLQLRMFAIGQTQSIGSGLLNQLKELLITYFAAKAVIDGTMTFGTMLSLQYIVGTLNGPINSFVDFIQSFQSAKLSADRIMNVFSKENEEDDGPKITQIGERAPIHIENLSFAYNQPEKLVLKNISLHIPPGKTTAIVGASGSGKTTLLNLLLKLYKPNSGEIRYGDIPLPQISNTVWRDQCCAVMQDGFLFSDTIANNICMFDQEMDEEKLIRAATLSNMYEFIMEQPLGFRTKIGEEGIRLSRGQSQRILIARVIYKQPDVILFDEATNSLDAANETEIMQNINAFFSDKTMIVVAHRLNTVIDAHQIIVLDKGAIIERGNHQSLITEKGVYYTLIKNQLELGE